MQLEHWINTAQVVELKVELPQVNSNALCDVLLPEMLYEISSAKFLLGICYEKQICS